jgi:hypothetical protein
MVCLLPKQILLHRCKADDRQERRHRYRSLRLLPEFPRYVLVRGIEALRTANQNRSRKPGAANDLAIVQPALIKLWLQVYASTS